MKSISSLHNKNIRQLLQLQEKSRTRRKEGLFVVEGLREINLAIAAGYMFTEIYTCPELFSAEHIPHINTSNATLINISQEVYQKIAYRNSTEGIIGVAKNKPHLLSAIELPKNPLILIAEAPEKPGNIGALLRTADAANVDAFFIANPRTDLYNPNIIRSSVGCVFTNNIAMASSAEIIAFLKEKNINIYTAILQEAKNYTSQNYKEASAIVVGTEADGLTDEWRSAATQNIKIPMEGKIDSMNVSVAAGILIFEAKRQRNN